MSDGAEHSKAGERCLSLAGGRLWSSRWSLAAAGVALFTVSGIAGGPFAAALAGFLLIALVIAMAPRGERLKETGSATAVQRLEQGGLSAADLAAAVSDPLIVFDGQGMVGLANAAAHAAFGAIEPGSALMLRFRSPEMQDFLRRALTDPAGVDRIDYLERVPYERLYRVSVKPAAVSGMSVLVFRDQSETRRIDRMRADFVANASHELRTPLASIAGFIDTLRGPARNDTAARDNFLQIMQDQTARMARLIDDLLSLSRLEMKALIDPDVTVDLTALLDGVIDALTPLAAESGVSITRAFPAGRVLVTGSRDELIQVFENLLENACKYGQSGGSVAVSIEEADSGNSREVRVTVRDFGPGIAEEHIPRLTERFYRVEVETSRAQKGTGLGLAIVKHILTRHNGYLSIASQPGEGAAFTVHLPVA